MQDAPRILKFGGSSLGQVGPLGQVLDIVARERELGRIAVVVSALGDTTDWLLDAAQAAASGAPEAAEAVVDRIGALATAAVGAALAARGKTWHALDEVVATELLPLRILLQGIAAVGECSPRVRDRVLAFGEPLAASVVAGALRAVGVAAERVDARTWLVTDDQHGNASVDLEATRARVDALGGAWFAGETAERTVTVHTGFIGATSEEVTTTLGRNGSDYTAALLAAVTKARELAIWTDVSGIMTADPGLVAEAYPVEALSYREVLELAGLGLRILHPRTVVPLRAAGITLRIRNTMRPDDPGTVIDEEGSADERRPTCIVTLDDMAIIDVEGTLRSGAARIAPRVLLALADASIPVHFAVPAAQGNGIAFVVHRADEHRAVSVVDGELARERDLGMLGASRVVSPVSVVTLVAEAMGRTVNVAGRFFGAVGASGISVMAASQGATSRAISCVVAAADTARAAQVVHEAFNLAASRVSVLLLGKGTVGGALLAQVASQRGVLGARHDVDLRLAGVSDSKGAWFDEEGIDPTALRDELRVAGEESTTTRLLDRLRRLPIPVLVDCTAADGMERLYEAALARGIHVVTANKKALALPTLARDALFAAARHAHRDFRYETTVGASLPVIDTLQNLVRTGDRVQLIEGSLSGTLGFLSNEVTRGVRLSVAVRSARERGYTEPHPRDDLSGVDAARKALILARELGFAIDLSDVVVEPFLPARLFVHDDVEAFLAAVATHDDAFEEQLARLRGDGLVLRYLATVTAPRAADGAVTVRVGPLAVPADHPAARLKGTEALVAFRTERYSETPLVIQGAGAGGSITASGVLADILAIARARRGR